MTQDPETARALGLTHGQVCYLQLPAADRNRAAAFYRAVFGWQTEAHHPDFVPRIDRGVVYKDPATFGEYQLSYRSGDILSPQIAATEPLVTELAEFLRLIRAGETSGTLELARQVVMLAEAAESSLANGGVPVALSDYSGSLA